MHTMVRTLTVTNGGDGSGLTLPQAVRRAKSSETVIRFEEGVSSVTLDEAVEIAGRARITIDGDTVTILHVRHGRRDIWRP